VFEALVARVLRGTGVTSPAQRAEAAAPSGGGPYFEKLRAHAYKITDEDVAALKAAGMDEETIFELTIAAAVGVAERRLAAAMEAIDAAE
jgi:alkylhydroperoxidase family enzyme